LPHQSGHYSTTALKWACEEIGKDRVLFSIDTPYEELEQGAEWWDTAEISEEDRLQIGRTNAIRLLGLPLSEKVEEQ
jgi:predicted TIM-barrel fold metal-dependent hydrolase